MDTTALIQGHRPLVMKQKTGLNYFSVPGFTRKKINLNYIIDEICETYKVTISDLKSPSRKWIIVEPRHVIFYLARRYTRLSLNDIGGEFNRDHATVLNGFRTVQDLIATDKTFKHKVESLESRINSKYLLK